MRYLIGDRVEFICEKGNEYQGTVIGVIKKKYPLEITVRVQHENLSEEFTIEEYQVRQQWRRQFPVKFEQQTIDDQTQVWRSTGGFDYSC